MLRWPNLVGAAIVFALLAWFALSVRHAFVQAGKFRAEVTRREQIESQFSDYRRIREEQDAKRDKSLQDYQNEITALRSTNSRSYAPVRLCHTPAANVPTTATTPGGTETATAAPGLVPGGAGENSQGRDIGPALRSLLDRADLLSAQTRAILALEGD